MTEDQKLLSDLVQKSPYSMEDWELALDLFDKWLHQRKKPAATLKAKLSYMACCVEGAGTSSAPLWKVLRDYLESYGFEGREG